MEILNDLRTQIFITENQISHRFIFPFIPSASLHTNETRIQPGVIDDLAGSVAGGAKPARVLKQLHGLKSLVGRGEADGLEEALRELRSSTSLSAGG